MIEVLLVDDETYVTESLAATIPWRDLGVSQIYQAASAIEAMSLLEEQSIDIMITDIRMPGMDGLELIEQAQQRWPDLRCMLLTGYSDFQYAKKAIQLKAVDYLLKPVNDDDFILNLEQHISALRQEWEKAEQYHRLVYSRKSDLGVLRQNLLQELVLGGIRSAEAIRSKLAQYEIAVQVNDTALLMAVQLGKRFERMDAASVALMEYAIGNIAEDIFGAPYRVWHGKAPHDCLVIIVSAAPETDSFAFVKERIYKLGAIFQQEVGSYLKGDIALVISHWFTFPEGLSAAYREALAAMFRLKQEETALLFMEDMPDSPRTGANAIEELYKPPSLIHLLEARQWAAARSKLDKLFDAMAGSPISREELYEIYFTVMNASLYVSHKQGLDAGGMAPAGVDIWLDRSRFSSLDKLKGWAAETLGRLERQTEDGGESYSKKHIICQVQELVTGDPGADVSVKTIADKVFLHPVYLSKIFKNETGESLGDYIIRIRMERAVYLLKHTNKKIYEITAELGYQNPQYFSKVFKKVYGMTPNEYRDQ